MAHICASRWSPRPASRYDVRVYSNCDEVELFFNGLSIGLMPVTGHVAVWQDLHFIAGMNELRAIGRRGGSEVIDKVTIVGE